MNRTTILNWNNISIAEPQDCTLEECNEGKKKQFYAFIKMVYKGLYHIESNVNGAKSPLLVFCQVEIGLIRMQTMRFVICF